MYNYRDKSNKYIGKLNILIGGQPITLRKSYIQLIILDIKERIYEYAKKFNSYTWEEQLIIWNNIYDNIDSTDDTIIDTIDEIDKYLPSFLLIWSGYYGYYENFPYYSVIDNIPEWKLPQRNPLKENVLLKLILENLQNKENLKKLHSEELLYPTYPYYEDPIIIKSSDSDDIIPISKFCRFNYSNIIGCYNKKCPKIHFPHPFSDNIKCHNDSNCRNYEKNICIKFHTKQKQSLVFKKGLAHRRENLIGIKKLGLKHLQYRKENIIFNNGRIIFQDDQDDIIQQIPINPLIHKISDIDIVNESNDNKEQILNNKSLNIISIPSNREKVSLEDLEELEKNKNLNNRLTEEEINSMEEYNRKIAIDMENLQLQYNELVEFIAKNNNPNKKLTEEQKKELEEKKELKEEIEKELIKYDIIKKTKRGNTKKNNNTSGQITDEELEKKKNEINSTNLIINALIPYYKNQIDSFNENVNNFNTNFKNHKRDLEKLKEDYDSIYERLIQDDKENIDKIRNDVISIIKNYKLFIDKINNYKLYINKTDNYIIDTNNILREEINNIIDSQKKYINSLENISKYENYLKRENTNLDDSYISIYNKYLLELNIHKNKNSVSNSNTKFDNKS